ncbi:DUF4397 domain-containing protein [Zhouia sp. PK063]|uniref:DUF4397 domain-containing protein n=1 Tax=Zhouia sp. PK063 TaxID=3373602 RepID=UPI00378D7319
MKAIKLKQILMPFLCMVIFSCDDDDVNYYTNNVAYGTLVNASPNSGELFMYADDNIINQNALNYTDVRGYYNFYTGDRVFYLRDQQGHTLDSLAVSLNDYDQFSLFAVNTFDEISIEKYDDNVSYPGAGKAKVRFINLSPDAPKITITVNNNILGEELQFKNASSYFSFDKGTYSLKIINSGSGEVLYEDANVDWYGGRIYTIYTKGYVTPPSGSNDIFSTQTIVNF